MKRFVHLSSTPNRTWLPTIFVFSIVTMLIHFSKLASAFQLTATGSVRRTTKTATVTTTAMAKGQRKQIDMLMYLHRRQRHYSRSFSLKSSSTQQNNINDDKSTKTILSTIPGSTNEIAKCDINYMNEALDAAKLGLGNTYPNPAVGCVLVEHPPSNQPGDDISNNDNIDADGNVVVGIGFHPKAGYPHAEIFALFAACGYVDSGIEAARTVVRNTSSSGMDKNNHDKENDKTTMENINKLLELYSSQGEDEGNGQVDRSKGAKTLFQNKASPGT